MNTVQLTEQNRTEQLSRLQATEVLSIDWLGDIWCRPLWASFGSCYMLPVGKTKCHITMYEEGWGWSVVQCPFMPERLVSQKNNNNSGLFMMLTMHRLKHHFSWHELCWCQRLPSADTFYMSTTRLGAGSFAVACSCIWKWFPVSLHLEGNYVHFKQLLKWNVCLIKGDDTHSNKLRQYYGNFLAP